jgi:ACS family glucarate transporter-like MFS transporter
VPTRYLFIAGTFLLSMLLYVDRVCISAAKDDVAGDLGFSDREMGWVFAAFSLGYALFQTPAGLLADRYGPRVVLTLVVCCWSLFTALTAAARQLGSMLAVRFLFGAGEAGAFPGMARAVFAWLPMAERGLAQGISFSAARLGAAAALPGVTWMVGAFGWRASFVVLGVVGFVWAAGWYLWFRDDPATHPGVSAAERDHILAHRQQATADGPGPRLTAGALVRSVNLWLLMGQYFASNFTFFFCLTWLLPHLADQYELSPAAAGWYATAPLLAGMVGHWVSGALVDGIYRRGHWRRSRRLPATVGFVLAAGGLLASLATDSAAGAVACLAVATFGADMTISPSWSLCIDIGRRNAGAVSGTMNMAGNIGSFVTALAFPYLRAWTGSVVPFFLVGAGLNLVAIVLWQFTRPDRPLEEW